MTIDIPSLDENLAFSAKKATPARLKRILAIAHDYGRIGEFAASWIATCEETYPLLDEDISVLEKLVKILNEKNVDITKAQKIVFFYFELFNRRFDGKSAPIIAEEAIKIRMAINATLDITETTTDNEAPFMSEPSRATLLDQLKLQHGDTGQKLHFWETYKDWETIDTDLTGESVGAGPSAKIVSTLRDEYNEEYVVKPSDIEVEKEYDDPRKIALFQEITRYYGVKTVPEVTVLPSKELFKAQSRGNFLRTIQIHLSPTGAGCPMQTYDRCMCVAEEKYEQKKARSIRIAKRIPYMRLPGAKQTRADLREDDRNVLEEWIPGEIFDDTREWSYRDTQGKTGLTNRKIATLNKEKFKTWYKSLSAANADKMRASLLAVHQLVSDGFLIDLYAPFNFAIRDHEFILIDVEPMQLSNLPGGTPCISYSQQVLNEMFEVVGLQRINYSETVKQHYGVEKYLKLMHSHGAQSDPESGMIPTPSEYWATNVTDTEELNHYRKQLDAKKKELGELPPRTDLHPSLIAEYYRLLELPDSFFEHENYDWNLKE